MKDLSDYNAGQIHHEICQRIKIDSISTYALKCELYRRGEFDYWTPPRWWPMWERDVGFVQVCADHFGLTVDQLTGPSRERKVSDHRLTSMAVAFKVLSIQGIAVALLFGRKDRSSALHARQTVAKRWDLQQEATYLENKWKMHANKWKSDEADCVGLVEDA